MGTELLILIGSIVGGTGAMLSFWAGWRARAEWEVKPSGSYGLPPGYFSINYPDPSPDRRPTNPYSGEPVTFTEGRTQRGNGNGGPSTSKPAIIPKPQSPAGRVIGPDGSTIGYMPIPEWPGANPPPREP
jgi:hypothetical protein